MTGIQERRGLDDAIEESYILTAEYAGEIQAFYQLRIGTIKDLYEKFYLNFSILVELTECLDSMTSEKDVVKESIEWLNLPRLPTNPGEIESRCNTGIEIFRKYKKAISNQGLIALPTRVR